jgi:hypothetical protein
MDLFDVGRTATVAAIQRRGKIFYFQRSPARDLKRIGMHNCAPAAV